jgi:hypothetical protein
LSALSLGFKICLFSYQWSDVSALVNKTAV